MRAAVGKRKKGWAAVAPAAALAAVLAMLGAAGAGEGEAWNAERAFLEMERLQAEIGVLRALAGAQAALLALNRERAESGAAPVLLQQGLCAEEELAPWCRVLPATFGANAVSGTNVSGTSVMAADGRDGKDGRR